MLIIPAVDLKGGKVVRLFQGQAERETAYSNDPAGVALHWKDKGAKLIHVVDLDGAFSGTLKNVEALKEIIASVKGVRIEFGGGVRSRDSVKEVLDMGVWRVVLGTVALENKDLLNDIAEEYGEKMIVSVDIRSDGLMATKGWAENSSRQDSLIEVAKMLSRAGINKIIYTDIERDGTLQGIKIDSLRNYLNMFKKSGLDISLIVAGGISSLDDLRGIKKLEGEGLAIEGVIIGKALYEGRFTFAQALQFS